MMSEPTGARSGHTEDGEGSSSLHPTGSPATEDLSLEDRVARAVAASIKDALAPILASLPISQPTVTPQPGSSSGSLDPQPGAQPSRQEGESPPPRTCTDLGLDTMALRGRN